MDVNVEQELLLLGARRLKKDTKKIALFELNHRHFALSLKNQNSYSVYTEYFSQKEQFKDNLKKEYLPGNTKVHSNIKAYPSKLTEDSKRYLYNFATFQELKQFLVKYSES